MSVDAPRPLLLLRVDVSREHGTGHLMRSKALGDAWQRSGGRVEFLTASNLAPYGEWLWDWPVHSLHSAPWSPADAEETRALARERAASWVAADGYHFDATWQMAFGGETRLLFFDDYGHGAPHSAAAVLNQNPGAAETLYAARREGTQLLLGPRFALLREQFASWRGWSRTTCPEPRRLLVTFGGADPAGVTLQAIKALRDLPLEAEVVVGAANAHGPEIEAACAGTNLRVRRHVLDMPELMASCDFALCAAGSTTLEAAFLQLPQLLITVADNQLLLADALVESGAAELLGWYTTVSSEQIAAAVRNAQPAERRCAMSAAGARLVDGWGAERVVTHLRARSFHLRLADARDEQRTWEWANDPLTRVSFFNPAPIPWDVHQAWFARQVEDPQARVFIAEETPGGDKAFGLVRFSLIGEEADISVVLAPAARGLGHAAPLILRGSHALLHEGVRVIHAYIKPENAASQAAFTRAGYRRHAAVEMPSGRAEHFTLAAAHVPIYERA